MKFNKEWREKISKALTGRKLSPEHRNKCKFGRLGKSAWNKGIPMKQEVKERMIATQKGKHYSPKTEFKKGQKGDKAGHWKNGIYFNGKYKYIYQPNHPNKRMGKYVLEHRLVMEKYLGRYLKPKESVHHIDGNKLNNSITNLKLFSTESEHQKHHHKLKTASRTKHCARLPI